MLEVSYIISKLTDKQIQGIECVLEENYAYADVSLDLFKAYREEDLSKIDELKENLDYNTFKIFERIVYRSCLEYFELKDVHYQELILTSMFYMLHGNAEADYKKREEKLADLFNQLKFYGIEEVSTPLLKELVRLNKNSPLKTVYKHLFKKYQKINHVSSLLVELLEELNGTLNESKNEELKKRQIRIFKQIRKLAGENASPVNESFCLISLLILSLEAGQTQLLYAKEESLADLLNNCQTKVNSLPFGFTKHYLNNILTYLKIKGLIREGENKLALQTLNSMSTSAIEAYNFNLDSSHFYALKDELQKPKYIKRQNYFNLIKTPFIDIHFENRGVSGDRLSYS